MSPLKPIKRLSSLPPRAETGSVESLERGAPAKVHAPTLTQNRTNDGAKQLRGERFTSPASAPHMPRGGQRSFVGAGLGSQSLREDIDAGPCRRAPNR